MPCSRAGQLFFLGVDSRADLELRSRVHDVQRVWEAPQLFLSAVLALLCEREQLGPQVLLPLVELPPDVRRDEFDRGLVVRSRHDYVGELGRRLHE